MSIGTFRAGFKFDIHVETWNVVGSYHTLNPVTSTAHIYWSGSRKRTALLLAVILAVLMGAFWMWGYILEDEYPFWPTLWIAEQTKVPDGTRVATLIRVRSGSSYVDQHWHHCTWCDVVYPHAQHMAIQVTINANEKEFYLFDWDVWHRRLLPITVRTAKLFPELIPAGCTVDPSGVGLNPQLYDNDEPCRIVTQLAKR
jgi:hypothetical protein